MSTTRTRLAAILLLAALAPAQNAGTGGKPAPGAAAEKLAKRLPKSPHVVRKDESVWLESPGKKSAYRVLRVSRPGNPVVETAAGPLEIQRVVLLATPHALDAVTGLLERAAAAKVALDKALLGFDPLLGALLRLERHLVTLDATLAPRAVPPERMLPAEELVALVGRVQPVIERSPLNAIAKKALRATLELLHTTKDKEGHVHPRHARRLVRSGWLRHLIPATPEVRALEEALTEGMRLHKRRHFTGEGFDAVEYRDSFGAGGWTLVGPQRSAYRARTAESSGLPALDVVIELPQGTDPTAGPAAATAATAYFFGIRLASWSAKKGLEVDAEWKRRIQARTYMSMVNGYLPPHVVLVDLEGKAREIITAHGRLAPPADRMKAAADAFIAAAARVLPDAPHLDLIREHFFEYVHDSPDTRAPLLTGIPTALGDIHQTYYQTLATTTDGVFRGDCDDLAELYQAVVAKQGKIGHIMGLPGHNAFGFVEKVGRSFKTFVLHTGRPLEFTSRRVERSLQNAYTFLAPEVPFDPAEVPIAVRFSGENKRSEWILSHRIYTDPTYSRTMIDIQRDWHYHTYRRGVIKMQKLIEDGDRDPANYRELGGLSERTGQWGLAAEYLATAEKAGKDRVLSLATRRLGNLYEAGQLDAARKEARDILDNRLRAVRRTQGPMAYWAVVAGFASQLLQAEREDKLMALEALEDTLRAQLSRQITLVARYARSSAFNERLWKSPVYEQIRDMLRGYVSLSTVLLKELGKDPDLAARLRPLRRDVELWMRDVAMRDVSDPSDRLRRYALLGSYYRTLLGDDAFFAKLDAAPFAKSIPAKLPKRAAGIANLDADLPWIKASVPFWFGALTEQFADDKSTLDPVAIRAFAAKAAAAHRATHELGLQDTTFDYLSYSCDFVAAFVGEDGGRVRKLFRRIREQNDKPLRDVTSTWIGTAARYASPGWFRQVLRMWRQEVDFKPSYFNIAWTAALNDAPRRALETAAYAAELFRDDPAFVEEHAYMKELLLK